MLKPWTLEKIPRLNEGAFRAVVQSMAQSVLNRRLPLALPYRASAVFAQTRWEDLGCAAEDLAEIAALHNAMFHTQLAAPQPHEPAGIFCAAGCARWQEGTRHATFFTSGSTGKPTPCTHHEDDLRQEVANLAPLIGSPTAALATAPLHHLYGFTFGMLLPLALGIPVRGVPPLPPLVSAQARPGDMLVGIPLLWTRLVQSDVWARRHQPGAGITCISSTGPTPVPVLRALLESGVRLLEIFGASEIGAVCWREDPEATFTLLPHVRRAEAGHSESVLERTLPDGRLAVYPLQDVVRWTGPRRLLPGPRRDKAVQVGSVNVYPEYVRKVLEEHEGVQQCSVRLMRPEEGFRLKTFVVPAEGWHASALRLALKAYAKQRLNNAERPAAYTFGEALPKNPLGKLADW